MAEGNGGPEGPSRKVAAIRKAPARAADRVSGTTATLVAGTAGEHGHSPRHAKSETSASPVQVKEAPARVSPTVSTADTQDARFAAPVDADTTLKDQTQVAEAVNGGRELGAEDYAAVARGKRLDTVQIVEAEASAKDQADTQALPEAAPPAAESSKKLVVEGKVATNEAVVQEGSRVGRAVHQRREAAEKGRARAEKKQKRREDRDARLNITKDDTGAARKAKVVARTFKRAPQAFRERAQAKAERLGTTDAGWVEKRRAGAADIIDRTPEAAKVVAEAAGKYFKMTNESMRGRAAKSRGGLEAVVLQASLGGTRTMSDALDHKLTEIEQKQRDIAPPKEKEKKGLRDRVREIGKKAAMQAREIPAAKAKIVAEIMDRVEAGNIKEAIDLYKDEELVNLVIQHHSGEAAAIVSVARSVSAGDVGEAASHAFNITFDEATTAAFGEGLTPFIEKRAQEIKAARERTTAPDERAEHTKREFTLIDYMGWLQDSEAGQKFLREHPEITPFGAAQMIDRTVDSFADAALNTVAELEAEGNTVADAILRNQAEAGALSWEFGDTDAEVRKRIKARGAGEGAAFMAAYEEARGSGATNTEALEAALKVDVKEAAKRAAHDAGIYLAKYGVRWPARLAILAQLGSVGWKATPAGLVASSALGAAMAGGLGFVKGWERAREGVDLAELEAERNMQLSATGQERKIEEDRDKKGHRGRRLRYMFGSGAKTAGKAALAGAIGAPIAAEVIGGIERPVIHAFTGSGGGHVDAPGPGNTVGNGNQPGGYEAGGNGGGGSNLPVQGGNGHEAVAQLAAYDTRSDGNPQLGETILVGKKEIPVSLGTTDIFKDGAIVGTEPGDPGISAQHLEQFEELMAQRKLPKGESYVYDHGGGFSIVDKNNEAVGRIFYDQSVDKFKFIGLKPTSEGTTATGAVQTLTPNERQPVNALVVDQTDKTVIVTSNDETEITLAGVTVDTDHLIDATTNQQILSVAQLEAMTSRIPPQLFEGRNLGLALQSSDQSGSRWQVTQNGNSDGLPEVTIKLNGTIELNNQPVDLTAILSKLPLSHQAQGDGGPGGAPEVIHVGQNITIETVGFTQGPDGGLLAAGHEVLTKGQLDGIANHVHVVNAEGSPVPVEVVVENHGGKPVVMVYDSNHEPILTNEQIGRVPEYQNGSVMMHVVDGQRVPVEVWGADWQAAKGIETQFDGRGLTIHVPDNVLAYHGGEKPPVEWTTFNGAEWLGQVEQAVANGPVAQVGPLQIQGMYVGADGALYVGNPEFHLYVMSKDHFNEFSTALTDHLHFQEVTGGHVDPATGQIEGGIVTDVRPLLHFNGHGFDVINADTKKVLLHDVTFSDKGGHPVLEWDKQSDVVTFNPNLMDQSVTLKMYDGITDAQAPNELHEIPNQLDIGRVLQEVKGEVQAIEQVLPGSIPGNNVAPSGEHVPVPGSGSQGSIPEIESTQQFFEQHGYNPNHIEFAQQGTLHTVLIDNGNTERIIEEGGVHSTHLAFEVDGKKVYVQVKYDEQGRSYVDVPLNDKSSYFHERLSVYGHTQPIEAGSLSAFENQTNLSSYIKNDLPAGTIHNGTGDIAVAEYQGGVATVNASSISFCKITNANGETTVIYNNAIQGTGNMPDQIEVGSGQPGDGVPLTVGQQPTGGPSGQAAQFGPIEIEGLPDISQGITIGGQHLTGAQLQEVGQLVQERLHFQAYGTNGNIAVNLEVVVNKDGSITILDVQTKEPLVADAQIEINPQTQHVELVGNAVESQTVHANGVTTVTFDGHNLSLAKTTIDLNVQGGSSLQALQALIDAKQAAAASATLPVHLPGSEADAHVPPGQITKIVIVNPSNPQQTTAIDLHGATLQGGALYENGNPIISAAAMKEYETYLPQLHVADGTGPVHGQFIPDGNGGFVFETPDGTQVLTGVHLAGNQVQFTVASGHTVMLGNNTITGDTIATSQFSQSPEFLLEVSAKQITAITPEGMSIPLTDVSMDNAGEVIDTQGNVVLTEHGFDNLLGRINTEIAAHESEVKSVNVQYLGNNSWDIHAESNLPFGIGSRTLHLFTAPDGRVADHPIASGSPLPQHGNEMPQGDGSQSSAVIHEQTITGSEVARTWESLSAKPGTIKEVAFDTSHQYDMSARVIEYQGHKAIEIFMSGGDAKYMAFQMDINGRHETIFVQAVQDGNGRSHFVFAPAATDQVQYSADGVTTSTIPASTLAQLMLHERDLSHLPLGDLTVAQESELFRPKVVSAADFTDGKVTYKAALLGDNQLASEVTGTSGTQFETGSGHYGRHSSGNGRRPDTGDTMAVTSSTDRPLHAVESTIAYELDTHHKEEALAGAITAGYGLLGAAQPVDRRWTPANRIRQRARNAGRFARRGAILGLGVAALGPLTGSIAGAAKAGAEVGGIAGAVIGAVRPFEDARRRPNGRLRNERVIRAGADLNGRRFRRVRRWVRTALLIAGHGAERAVPGAYIGGAAAAGMAAGAHALGVGAGSGGAGTGEVQRNVAMVAGGSRAEAIGPLMHGIGTDRLVEGMAALGVVGAYEARRTARAWAARRRGGAPAGPNPPPGRKVPAQQGRPAPTAGTANPRRPAPPPTAPPAPFGPRPPMPGIVRGALHGGAVVGGALIDRANSALNPWNEGRRLRRRQMNGDIGIFGDDAQPPAARRDAAIDYLQYKNVRVRPAGGLSRARRQALTLRVAGGLAERIFAVPVLPDSARLHTSRLNLLSKMPVVGLEEVDRNAVRAMYQNVNTFLDGYVNNHLETPGNAGVGLTRAALNEMYRIIGVEPGSPDRALADDMRNYATRTPTQQRAIINNLLDTLING
jgi:hypothetical protein